MGVVDEAGRPQQRITFLFSRALPALQETLLEPQQAAAVAAAIIADLQNSEQQQQQQQQQQQGTPFNQFLHGQQAHAGVSSYGAPQYGWYLADTTCQQQQQQQLEMTSSMPQAAQLPIPSRSSKTYSGCSVSTPAAAGDGLLSLLLEDGPHAADDGQLSIAQCSLGGVLGTQHLLQPDHVPHALHSQPSLPQALGLPVSQPVQHLGLQQQQQQQQTLMAQAPALSGGHALFTSHISSCGMAAANYSQTISIGVVGEHQAVLAPPAVAPAPPPPLQLLHQTQQQQQQQQHGEAAMLDSGLLPSLDELMQEDDSLLLALLQPAGPGCLAGGAGSSIGKLHNLVCAPAAFDYLLLLDDHGWPGSSGAD
jgi:hypothetical protein